MTLDGGEIMDDRIPCYIGVDLNEKFAMVTYFKEGMKDPETVSQIIGSDNFQIPIAVAKKDDIWLYGKEALECGELYIDDLYNRALRNEKIEMLDETYEAVNLLGVFLKKVIALPTKLRTPVKQIKVTVAIDSINREKANMFYSIANKLSIKKEDFNLIDHKESFYCYVLSQEPNIYINEVFLFECNGEGLKKYRLKRDTGTKPQIISIEEEKISSFRSGEDKEFLEILQQSFESRRVSTIYLVGDGFDESWMLESLDFLCKGHRAFVGKNLFSKGACLSTIVKDGLVNWPYVYIGENDFKFNISLKVTRNRQMDFYSLISAGDNMYKAKGQCELILSKGNSIDFWKQFPASRDAKIETIELTGLPKREDKTTRVRVTVIPISDKRVAITVKDLGFGEIFKATDKEWNYTMTM